MEYPTFDLAQYFGVRTCAEIPWGHAVNNSQKLTEALKADIMLEADICICDSDPSRIVMAHPPLREGDLTIQEWVTQVLTHLEQHPNQKVGMKLDFKDPPAVATTLDFLAELFKNGKLSIPLWINADILAASPRPSPFNPEEFLMAVQSKLPGTVLSIGWTTTLDLPYTMAQADEMLALSQRHKLKHATFPLRSSLCSTSEEAIRALLAADPTYTLTVWDGPERMSRKDFDWLVKSLDAKRVFLDIGEPY